MIATHNGRLELTNSDMVLPPGASGQRVNLSCVWLRLDGGNWRTTGHRSLHKAVQIAKGFVDPEEAFCEMTDEME